MTKSRLVQMRLDPVLVDRVDAVAGPGKRSAWFDRVARAELDGPAGEVVAVPLVDPLGGVMVVVDEGLRARNFSGRVALSSRVVPSRPSAPIPKTGKRR